MPSTDITNINGFNSEDEKVRSMVLLSEFRQCGESLV